MDLIGKAAPPAPKAAPLTETFSTVTPIRKSSRGATVREKDTHRDAALLRKYKEDQLHALCLEAEHNKWYTEADLAADKLKWNLNRFTVRRYCEQCNLFFLVKSGIFGCAQHHHEHLDVVGSLGWENKMFFPVDVYPKAA